jgi:DNA-binding MarR family transcriptional regulator
MVEDLLEKLNETFQLFAEFNDKGFKENYSNLNINEVHTIDYIGKTEYANVTRITEHLKITKGGVTKITKKLISKEYITLYQKEENKKEKYFNLTEKGKLIYKKHKMLHSKASKRDMKIFEDFDKDEKKIVDKFLDKLKDEFENKLKNN